MKVVYISKDGKFFNIAETAEYKKENYYAVTEAVYNYAKKQEIKKGDEVEIQSESIDGRKTITKINRITGGGSKPDTTPNTETNETKPQKESTNNKAATLPQIPNFNSSYTYSDYQKPKTPEESDGIKKLSILSSVTQAVAALAGTIDVNVLGDVVESLYDRFYKKLS